jgi:hypothetical protein
VTAWSRISGSEALPERVTLSRSVARVMVAFAGTAPATSKARKPRRIKPWLVEPTKKCSPAPFESEPPEFW